MLTAKHIFLSIIFFLWCNATTGLGKAEPTYENIHFPWLTFDQGLQILLMSVVSVTSASQILESFWNIWSQVSQRKNHFQTFQHVVLACMCCS